MEPRRPRDPRWGSPRDSGGLSSSSFRPGSAGDQGDGAFPRKGLEVLFRSVGGTKTSCGRYRPEWVARFANVAADDIEHLLLPGVRRSMAELPVVFCAILSSLYI